MTSGALNYSVADTMATQPSSHSTSPEKGSVRITCNIYTPKQSLAVFSRLPGFVRLKFDERPNVCVVLFSQEHFAESAVKTITGNTNMGASLSGDFPPVIPSPSQTNSQVIALKPPQWISMVALEELLRDLPGFGRLWVCRPNNEALCMYQDVAQAWLAAHQVGKFASIAAHQVVHSCECHTCKPTAEFSVTALSGSHFQNIPTASSAYHAQYYSSFLAPQATAISNSQHQHGQDDQGGQKTISGGPSNHERRSSESGSYYRDRGSVETEALEQTIEGSMTERDVLLSQVKELSVTEQSNC
ncbi:uncharacterized protein EV422DRAFT_173120 [Fimicolochytrium jonesii]|uniref:uncharacterized protein n=1 Tax=Fimicolochytrium jonesii TaxID=1396493 RepID=UPI0022FF4532|nr:uncharacterized protein EV422DRAFT_173120 [Fimicolochytrium jonesii]KAI8818589.1 hypothetical protein EV422DRAFT_173120 [Fimicolochytrium jonesii]